MKTYQIFKRSRSFISILLVLLFVFNGIGQIRPMEISQYFQPTSRGAASLFRMHGRFAGGVVPHSTAEFITPGGKKIKANELKLVIKDKVKLANSEPDYDAIGILWHGKEYRFAVQDDLAYPMMKFIQRQGGYIAYTISGSPNEDYFKSNGLVRVEDSLSSYIAKEFNYDPHIDFLDGVDFAAAGEIEDYDLEQKIMNEAEKLDGKFILYGSEKSADINDDNSYLNADFNVKYQAFLVDSKKLVEVGGLPLRYHWKARNGTIKVTEVETFLYPEPEEGFNSQYKAILFFQAVAILRQFKQNNPREFTRFLGELAKIVGKNSR